MLRSLSASKTKQHPRTTREQAPHRSRLLSLISVPKVKPKAHKCRLRCIFSPRCLTLKHLPGNALVKTISSFILAHFLPWPAVLPDLLARSLSQKPWSEALARNLGLRPWPETLVWGLDLKPWSEALIWGLDLRPWPEALAWGLGQKPWPEALARSLGQKPWPEALARSLDYLFMKNN